MPRIDYDRHRAEAVRMRAEYVSAMVTAMLHWLRMAASMPGALVRPPRAR